jgi:2-oxoglutarate ferredoxin oxidoreductase subunit gamma
MLCFSRFIERKSTEIASPLVTMPDSALAEQFGNVRFANMIALGKLAKLTGALALTEIEEILKNFFSPDKHKFIPKNVETIRAGYGAV